MDDALKGLPFVTTPWTDGYAGWVTDGWVITVTEIDWFGRPAGHVRD